MASASKHEKRSHKTYRKSAVPAYMFATNAQRTAEKKFFRQMKYGTMLAADEPSKTIE